MYNRTHFKTFKQQLKIKNKNKSAEEKKRALSEKIKRKFKGLSQSKSQSLLSHQALYYDSSSHLSPSLSDANN